MSFHKEIPNLYTLPEALPVKQLTLQPCVQVHMIATLLYQATFLRQ